jgi:hypothetical protein
VTGATGAFERVAALLAAARSPDDQAPRAIYCAAARVAFDSAKAELQSLELNLVTLEAHLLEETALLKRRSAGTCEGKPQAAVVATGGKRA